MGAFVAGTVMLTGTACATSATSAAVVGGTSISEQSIFDQTAQVSAQASRTLTVEQSALVNRAFTTQDIRSALLARAAQDLGVVVTDAQVNAAMAGSTAGARDAGSYRDQLLLEALLSAHGTDALAFKNVTVTVDAARTSSYDQAVEVRKAILAVPADSPLPELGSGAEPLQTNTIDLSVPTDPVIDGVLSARPGDVLINQGTDGQFYVIRVIDRSEKPEQISATAILGVQDLSRQRQIAEVALLQQYAERVGVTVNPRMGVWDAQTLQVVATPTAS